MITNTTLNQHYMKMMSANGHYQHGMVTLLIATVILFMISALTMLGANIGIIEQRLSANTYYTKQAAELAQSGLEASMVLLDKNQITSDDEDNGNIDDQVTLTDLEGNPIGYYTAKYQTISNGIYDNLKITVTGTSINTNSSKSIEQNIVFEPFLSLLPPATMVVHGDVVLNSEVTLDNQSTDPNDNGIWWDTVIWAGGSVQRNGAQIPETDSNYERIYPDTETLSNLSSDGFFENFFIESKEIVKANSTRVDCQVSTCTTATLGANSGLIWATGTIDIDEDLGDQDNPILLIADITDGEFNLSSNATIYGLVYIDGDWNESSNGTINGAIIVNGSVAIEGTINITYDQETLLNLQDRIVYPIRTAGTWRDD